MLVFPASFIGLACSVVILNASFIKSGGDVGQVAGHMWNTLFPLASVVVFFAAGYVTAAKNDRAATLWLLLVCLLALLCVFLLKPHNWIPYITWFFTSWLCVTVALDCKGRWRRGGDGAKGMG